MEEPGSKEGVMDRERDKRILTKSIAETSFQPLEDTTIKSTDYGRLHLVYHLSCVRGISVMFYMDDMLRLDDYPADAAWVR